MKNTFFAIMILITVHKEVHSQFNVVDKFGKLNYQISVANENSKEKKDSIPPVLPSSTLSETIAYPLSSQGATIKRFYPPLKRIIPTSHFGWRRHPVTGEEKFHTGIDLKANYEPVYCITDGVVSFSGRGAIEGNYVIIDHGQVSSIYCHLSKILFSNGQVIKAGEVLGISGNTGRSTGPHLHFGLKWGQAKFDPKSLLRLILIANKLQFKVAR